jgi:hypothetical protein
MTPLRWSTYNRQIHRSTKVIKGDQGLEGGEMESFHLMGTVSFGDEKKNSRNEYCGSYTTLWMYLMPLNYTLKMTNGKFYVMYILSQFFKCKNFKGSQKFYVFIVVFWAKRTTQLKVW